ncbi:ABC transporter substrate-binding protein [Bacillaceae bacterium W0354]
MKFKKLSLALSMLVFTLLFAACSADDGDSKDGDVVELEMYSWRAEDRAAYEKIIEAFEDANPGIKVKFQPFESTEYNTILTNAIISGEGPDIAQLRPYSGTKTLADNGDLAKLDDISGIDSINSDYLDAARGSDGSVYGVPLTLNAGVIFYNKGLFEKYNLEAPTTWDEFMEVSAELKANGITPVAQAGRAAYLLSMLHGVVSPSLYGGNDLVEDLLNGDTDLHDERLLASLDRLLELEQYLPKDFIALDDNDAQALFYAEEAAMYINGDYRLGTFEKNAPDMELGVIPALKIDGTDDAPVMTWVDGSYGVLESSKNKEAALKFMEFMTTKEFGQIFTDEFNRVSAVDGVTPKHEIVQQVSDAKSKSSTPYLFLVHFGQGSPTTKTVFEDSLQGMFLDEISKEDVLDAAQENYERVLAEEEGK